MMDVKKTGVAVVNRAMPNLLFKDHMKSILVIQQWISAHQMYIEKWSTVLSGNDIVFPNQIGSANALLSAAQVSFYLTSGVAFPDGWSYYKSAAVPVVADPAVTLPVNVEAEPPTVSVPGDYEIRCRVIRQF